MSKNINSQIGTYKVIRKLENDKVEINKNLQRKNGMTAHTDAYENVNAVN